MMLSLSRQQQFDIFIRFFAAATAMPLRAIADSC